MSARRQPSVQLLSSGVVGLVQFAASDQHQRGERGHRLGGGEHIGDRVLGPRRGALLVGPAAPQINHHLAVDVEGERGTEVFARLELGSEQLAQRLEAGTARATQKRRVIVHEAPVLKLRRSRRRCGAAGCN